MFESILYTDPQAAKPACFCPKCGGECYWPSLVCIRCQSVKVRSVECGEWRVECGVRSEELGVRS